MQVSHAAPRTRTVAAEIPADLALIKELVSTKEYKFLHPPSQHRLQSIKDLQAWFTDIAKMLDRFPNIEAFMFGTAASLNEDQELSIRITAVKSEIGVKQEHSPPDNDALRRAISVELRRFDREFTDFNVVAEFLSTTSYAKEIRASQDLYHFIAPTLFHPSVDAKKILSRVAQYKSPEFQETVTVGDKLGGGTPVSDLKVYVFPSEQRITNAKSVTFHYVKGDQKPESRIHQLLRPHLWRWLEIALGGGDFAHFLTMGWEEDHAEVFQQLILQQDREREETDQVFAILDVQDSLRTKSATVSLKTWYLQSTKAVEKVNAVTRTYKAGCNLMILPQAFVDSMYMVHAHHDGYAEILSRVSRENEGYVPIKELQRQIGMQLADKNRNKTFTDWSAKNTKSSNQQRIQPSQTSVNVTLAKVPDTQIDVCFKFQEDKCKLGADCQYPHRKIAVPGAACSKWLADKSSCDHSCNKLHETWAALIKKIKSGEISADKEKKGKIVKGRSGKGGSNAPDPTPTPTPASVVSTPSQPELCTRCGKKGHVFDKCWVFNHADGHRLTSQKPCPEPEVFKADRQARYDREQGDKGKATTITAFTSTIPIEEDHYEEEACYWPSAQINMLKTGAGDPRL